MTLFSKKTFDFLSENRLRNSKEWFDGHRGEFDAFVMDPFKELVRELAPEMLAIDAQLIVEPRVDRTISRIRRDTRFSKDKSLYRDVMWCCFVRDKKIWGGPPGFVMELSPRGWRYGCGYYATDPRTMESARELILQGNPAFLSALSCYEKQDVFMLEGDAYKRSKFPSQPERLRSWLDRKTFWVVRNSDDWDLLCSDRLAQTLVRDFKLIKPVYEFFWAAENSKKRADATL